MKTPNNFLGIPEIPCSEAQVVILPIPFEQTTSYGKGTRFAPQAIIKASQQVELFILGKDEIQNLVKIATAPFVKGGKKIVSKTVRLYRNKFLISLGGEHSLTPLLVKPFLKKYPNLSVLQIDAHTDMRDKWEGKKDSHACAMRRLQELGIKQIVQVGVRNTAKEEQRFLNPDNIFWGNRFDLNKILAKLDKNVYLTFDVDALDISIMPATGTPEPGGLSYKQALEILKAVTGQKNLVAADFVELAPIKGIPAYDFLVAKLIFKLIGFKFYAT